MLSDKVRLVRSLLRGSERQLASRLTHINGSTDEQEERLADFLRRKMDAQFLFGPTLLLYLDDIQDAVDRSNETVRKLKAERSGEDDGRSTDVASAIEAAERLRRLHAELIDRFRPSLTLEKSTIPRCGADI